MIRPALERAREEALAAVAARTAELEALDAAARDSNADDEHDPEGHTLAYERQQVAVLRDEAQRRADDLAAALERVEAGTYGRCEQCGRDIGAERLEVRPQATTCVGCAGRR